MKKLLFLAVLSLCWTTSSQNRILYRQLYWADFKGAVPKDKGETAAETYCEMDLDQEETEGRYKFEVHAYFISDSSWVREKSERVLLHEQTHFRIAQIMALRCRQALKPYQGGDSVADLRAEQAFRSFGAKRDDLNREFDLATNHGLDKGQEEWWERSIRMQLLNLETSSEKKP